MSKSNDIPAFPCPLPHSGTGMSLRDYFAAMAMQSLLIRGYVGDSAGDIPRSYAEMEGSELGPECLSRDAYVIADAMLEIRKIDLNLQAGKRYLTVKPDGTAGPIVGPLYESYGMPRELIPFEFCDYWVGPTGLCAPNGNMPVLQITGEYREPTIAERLEKWRAKGRAERTQGEFAEIVEAVRKLEGGSK